MFLAGGRLAKIRRSLAIYRMTFIYAPTKRGERARASIYLFLSSAPSVPLYLRVYSLACSCHTGFFFLFPCTDQRSNRWKPLTFSFSASWHTATMQSQIRSFRVARACPRVAGNRYGSVLEGWPVSFVETTNDERRGIGRPKLIL